MRSLWFGRRLTTALVVPLVLAVWLGAALIVTGGSAGVSAAPPELAGGGADALPVGSRLLVRAVDDDAPRADGRVYALSADGALEAAGNLRCKRVHVSASGIGLCLQLGDNGIDYDGVVFDERYRPRRRFRVEGVPDRARVSPDGRYAGFTSFDAGAAQGYFETTGAFSTYTRVVDTGTGKILLRLEDLRLTEAGRPFETVAPEFWGLTFAAGGRYYATVATRGEHHLIQGRVGSRTAEVLRTRVECPSLSPDGARIAFKRRIGDRNRWRFHVLDLATGRETPLAEERSIDDQPEWLGDELIVYSDDLATFAVPADGSGEPEQIAAHAASPAFWAGP